MLYSFLLSQSSSQVFSRLGKSIHSPAETRRDFTEERNTFRGWKVGWLQLPASLSGYWLQDQHYDSILWPFFLHINLTLFFLYLFFDSQWCLEKQAKNFSEVYIRYFEEILPSLLVRYWFVLVYENLKVYGRKCHVCCHWIGNFMTPISPCNWGIAGYYELIFQRDRSINFRNSITLCTHRSNEM